MTDQPAPTEKSNKIRTLRIAGIIIIVAAIAAGSYLLWKQHSDTKKQLTSAQAQVATLKKQSASLSKSLDNANSEITTLKGITNKSSVPSAPLTLTLNVTDSTKDSRGYGYSGNYTLEQIVVDVSLTNNTSSTLPVLLSDFNLKDSNNVAYGPPTNYDAWPPAANKTALKNQSLDPGETLNGSFSFGNVPVSFDSFRLYYGTKVTTITPHDATYGWYTYPWCKGIEGTGQMGC